MFERFRSGEWIPPDVSFQGSAGSRAETVGGLRWVESAYSTVWLDRLPVERQPHCSFAEHKTYRA